MIDGARLNSDNLRLDSPVYALGKSIYYGRSRKARGLKVCLLVPEEGNEALKSVRLSRKVLKPFKNGPIVNLTTRLVDCRKPKSHIALILDQKDFLALMYFMNKRFHLKLES